MIVIFIANLCKGIPEVGSSIEDGQRDPVELILMVLRRRARTTVCRQDKSQVKAQGKERGQEDKLIGVAMKLCWKRTQADDKNNGRWRPVVPRSLERAYADSLSANGLPKDDGFEEGLPIQI